MPDLPNRHLYSRGADQNPRNGVNIHRNSQKNFFEDEREEGMRKRNSFEENFLESGISCLPYAASQYNCEKIERQGDYERILIFQNRFTNFVNKNKSSLLAQDGTVNQVIPPLTGYDILNYNQTNCTKSGRNRTRTRIKL